MLSRLSHPLAFATAPLDGTAPEYGRESFFVVGDEAHHAPGMGDTMIPITRSMAGTMLQQHPQQQPIQSQIMTDVPRNRKTLEEYEGENRQLKIAVDHLSRKVASYKEVFRPPPFPHSFNNMILICGVVDRKIFLLVIEK
jgi:hypothetical protein